jgi:hypothetical protein
MTMQDFENRVTELEKKVKRLEFRDGYHSTLHSELKSHFRSLNVFILENELNRVQVTGICDVLNWANKLIEESNPAGARDLEDRMKPFITNTRFGISANRFIESLLYVLQQTGQWYQVVDHYRAYYHVPRIELPPPW